MQIKEKAFSLLLSAILGMAMLVALPSPAYAEKPDLEFGLTANYDDVSKTMVYSIENGQSDSSIFSIAASSDPMTFTIGGSYTDYLVDTFTPQDLGIYPRVLAIGDYLAVLELDTDGTLINYGQHEIDNSDLRPPNLGTTRIAGGASKVTVSSYQQVAGCQLYLVPSGSLPVAYGKINLKESVEVTGNGDITGLAVDTYRLYTVWTDSITDPTSENYNHGAYRGEQTVTVALGPVCRIGSTNYPNLAAALAAVGPGETITLLQNITEDVLTYLSTTYNIDLDGYT
ncbi:MAG: hypothetical protein LBG68_00010 [Coriobacteriales bacterium]|nr:hypothetical protein [Coriobacteriales bacterium]